MIWALTNGHAVLRPIGLDDLGYESNECVARGTSREAAIAAMRLLGVVEYLDFAKPRASWSDAPTKLDAKGGE